MAKIGIFKKIAALATVIALVVCFAASASALEVTSTTYYGDGTDVNVDVTIDGEELAGKGTTVYAYKGDVPVFIDQFEDGETFYFFSFVTSKDNLYGDIKVGFTGAGAAESGKIGARTVTFDGVPAYITTDDAEATVTFNTSKAVIEESVTADNAVVESAVLADGVLTVSLSAIEGDVVLSFEEDTTATATVELIDAAMIIATGNDNETTDAEATASAGDRKLTAIAKVIGNASDYGIKVSDGETEDTYKAQNKSEKGFFAVQVITSDDNVLDASKDYDVKAYAGSAVSNVIAVSVN